MSKPIKVFIAYSHKDESLKDELIKHLAVARRNKLISEWHDRMLKGGDHMHEEIDAHLTTDDVILLLVSPDFIDSDYCYTKEMKIALERDKAKDATVVPIILRPTSQWTATDLGKIKGLPIDGKPITTFSNFDEGYFQVAEGLNSVFISVARSSSSTDSATKADEDSVQESFKSVYLEYVRSWEKMANLNDWTRWSGQVFWASQPRLLKGDSERLYELSRWLFSRTWPGTYPELEKAFESFRRALVDFLKLFHRHSDLQGNLYITEKFYKINKYDPKLYDELAEQYDAHIYLVEDVMVEITRLANFICDLTRDRLDNRFRIEEGVLCIEVGPFADDGAFLGTRIYRPEFGPMEREGILYESIKSYLEIRKTRNDNLTRREE